MPEHNPDNKCVKVSFIACSALCFLVLSITFFILSICLGKSKISILYKDAQYAFLVSGCLAIIALVQRCFVKRRYWWIGFIIISLHAIIFLLYLWAAFFIPVG